MLLSLIVQKLVWSIPIIIIVSAENVSPSCIAEQKVTTVPVKNILSEGQEIYGDSGNDPRFPCWFDLELARTGQQFAREHIAQIGLAHVLGLLPLIASQQTRRVMYSTKRSNTPETAFKRYTATGIHVKLWYHADILSSTWRKSTQNIRNIHKGVGHYLKSILDRSNQTYFNRPVVTKENNFNGFEPNQKMWEAFKADLQKSTYAPQVENATLKAILKHQPKELYNQYLFSLTQWAFVALPVLFTDKIMIPRWTEQDLHGFAHFWAVLSYMLGMDEKFILCRDPKDFRGCKRYIREMFHVHIIPALFDMDYEGELMVEAILRAPRNLVPTASADFLLIMLLEDILGIPANHLYQQARWQTRLSRWNVKSFGEPLLHWPIVQWFTNVLANGELQLAGNKAFNDPGTNLTAVAEGLYYLD